jgi:Tol biopolymer transport system component
MSRSRRPTPAWVRRSVRLGRALPGGSAVILAAVLTAGGESAAQPAHGAAPGTARGATHGGEGVMHHYPRWSPDGRWVLMQRMSHDGASLVIYPEAGGRPESLATPGVRPTAADWTRSGQVTFVTEIGGARQAYLMDRDGRNLRRIPHDSVTSSTPDSAVLLFESQRGGSSALFAMG